MNLRRTPALFRGARLWRVAVLSLLSVGVLVGCATSSPAGAGAVHPGHELAHSQSITDRSASRHHSGTAVHTFTAYSPSGKLTVATSGSRRGSCFTTSLAAPQRWSFRCISGNQILDPCFARSGTTRGTIACIADPWSSAVLLHLTHALPTHTYSGHRTWAARLADGAHCVAATGTVPEVHGVDLAFDCSDGTAAALRHVHTSHVTAVYARPGASRLHSSAVRTIWHV